MIIPAGDPGAAESLSFPTRGVARILASWFKGLGTAPGCNIPRIVGYIRSALFFPER
jgi:hypothetical protein